MFWWSSDSLQIAANDSWKDKGQSTWECQEMDEIGASYSQGCPKNFKVGWIWKYLRQSRWMHTSFTPTDSLAIFPLSVSSRTIRIYSDTTAVCMLIFATCKKKKKNNEYDTFNPIYDIRIRNSKPGIGRNGLDIASQDHMWRNFTGSKHAHGSMMAQNPIEVFTHSIWFIKYNVTSG